MGTHVVNFKVIDPRVENNPSWESDLTQDLNVSITVVSTLPVIQVAERDIPYRLADPLMELNDWISDVNVTDARGQALVYQQTESDRDLAEGFFYFEPYPDINATGSRDFKIIAVDWRAEQITKTISYSVESAPPTIDPDDSILTPELSSTLLTNVDHNISALDEFGNNVTISLDKVFDESGTQHELTENSSLLGLKNEQYTFVYQVTDFSRVSTEVEKSLQASATPPTLTVPSFESNYSNTHYTSLDPKNIELSDPLDEWSAWLQSIISRNYLGEDIKQNIQVTVTTPEGSITNISFSELALPTFAGEWKYKFTIQDARLEDVRFPEEWSTTLTVESEQTLTCDCL